MDLETPQLPRDRATPFPVNCLIVREGGSGAGAGRAGAGRAGRAGAGAGRAGADCSR